MYEIKCVMTKSFVITNITDLVIWRCFQKELGTLNPLIVHLVCRREHTRATTKSTKKHTHRQ